MLNSFYLSADTSGESGLFQIAGILSEQHKMKRLLADEIHFCKFYSGDLKKIYNFSGILI